MTFPTARPRAVYVPFFFSLLSGSCAHDLTLPERHAPNSKELYVYTPQPQLQKLWERLLKPSASDNGEGLTYRQFLHFLGVALDLAHVDDYERGYTAFHSFLDLAPAK